MGSFGAAGEDSGGKSFDKLGHFASEAISRVKVPVTIVKDAWASSTGDRSSLGHVLRTGRDGTPGLSFVVCVDGSKVSEQVIDILLTASLCYLLLSACSHLPLHAVSSSQHEATSNQQLATSSC